MAKPTPPKRLNKLIDAATSGDIVAVRALLESGCNPNHALADFGRTALHVAAGKGEFDILKLLIEAGGDPRGKDYDGLEPLHIAVMNGQVRLKPSEMFVLCCHMLLMQVMWLLMDGGVMHRDRSLPSWCVTMVVIRMRGQRCVF